MTPTRPQLQAALEQSAGNVTGAAIALGISLPTAKRLIASLGLRPWLDQQPRRRVTTPLLTTGEVIQLYDLPLDRFQWLCCRGRGPAHSLTEGGKRRFSPEEVEKWLAGKPPLHPQPATRRAPKASGKRALSAGEQWRLSKTVEARGWRAVAMEAGVTEPTVRRALEGGVLQARVVRALEGVAGENG